MFFHFFALLSVWKNCVCVFPVSTHRPLNSYSSRRRYEWCVQSHIDLSTSFGPASSSSICQLVLKERMKKKTVRYLRNAAKAPNGVKKMGRSKPRRDPDELVDMPIEAVTSVKAAVEVPEESSDEEVVGEESDEVKKVGAAQRYLFSDPLVDVVYPRFVDIVMNCAN
jgi:hypothetical protein